MLGAFRRSAVSHALRSSTRTLSTRSTQRFQSLYSSISRASPAPKPLLSPSCFRFYSQATATAEDGAGVQADLPTRFQDLADRNMVDRRIIDTITRQMGLETMTDVQRMTITESVKGADMFAQAKTGTGKTVAFLLPVLHRLVSDPTLNRASTRRGGNIDIRTIIISPTRELAEQIAVEARRVAAGSGLIIQTAVGGTQKRQKLEEIRRQGCHILVATPGRLRDILSDEYSGIRAPKLSSFVLDEADRLLDEGFAPELMEIQQLLPDPATVDRQTLMFSATLAPEVKTMVRRTMKPEFSFVKCVDDNEVPTHLSVPQKVVPLNGLENMIPALLELSKQNLNAPRPFKAIVYLNATKHVNTVYEIFDRLLTNPEDRRSGHPLGRMFRGEIHSRLTQAARTRVASVFRKCTSGILFSSDVTARGMDFPDVTHVIQVGVPRSREDYIHRLGRTARAGRTGEGWVFLHPQEIPTFRRMVRDIPMDKDETSLSTASFDMARNKVDPKAQDFTALDETSQTLVQVDAAAAQVPFSLKEEAVVAHMATIMSSFKDKRDLQDAVKDLCVHGYNLPGLPSLSRGMASNLGFSRDNGFNVRSGGGGGPRNNSFGGRNFGGRNASGRSFDDRYGGRDSRGGNNSYGRNNRDFGRSGGSGYGDRGHAGQRDGNSRSWRPRDQADEWA
ncbi:P-loop containing nucleoside triphosphate hydrolase protein [Aspergillus karnatakaensis]|uniref:DEAD/DEAH box helicase n=1 Tax=Aspergillus karnatakaensis TaxID=1810916 RepID=UPI003CCC9871